MATWRDAERIALAQPGAYGSTHFRNPAVKTAAGRTFLTLRPLRPRDLEELGSDAPEGETILVRVEHQLAKQALIEDEPAAFSVDHLDGYDGVLVALEQASAELLEELVVESFLVCEDS